MPFFPAGRGSLAHPKADTWMKAANGEMRYGVIFVWNVALNLYFEALAPIRGFRMPEWPCAGNLLSPTGRPLLSGIADTDGRVVVPESHGFCEWLLGFPVGFLIQSDRSLWMG